ncbi:HNH endonuclease [Arthrobacter caoxuetaonis]|uniref:HNH endonuclease n=1 Tax=Arthrobacter caoxuetaonis TaxID=2886935 RepID=A0A9X1SDA7_9MICC|nr:HNH endonuclease signature motif containing protein [Arthrobacter caoxuetaonis]MCC3296609.1 HNH endonuclease [Arthrobacter caoxuetaonis]USQ56563.1 HNH endonuclease [Arthrobacter caoxuetaonis]
MNHFSDTPFPRSADRDGGGAPGVETGGLSGASSSGSSGGLSGASSGDAPSASPGASPFDPSGFAGGFAASVFCADPALAEDAVADALPEGFAGRLSFRAAETLGYEQSVSALQRLGMLVSWAQTQQARAPGAGRKLPFPGLFSKCPHTEIDHTTPFSRGGPTDHTNLEHLCPKHHRFKTLGHWNARQPEPGTLQWNSPTGRTYSTQPALDYASAQQTTPGQRVPFQKTPLQEAQLSKDLNPASDPDSDPPPY